MNLPDYSDTQQLLRQARSLTDAAEAHGTLAGWPALRRVMVAT